MPQNTFSDPWNSSRSEYSQLTRTLFHKNMCFYVFWRIWGLYNWVDVPYEHLYIQIAIDHSKFMVFLSGDHILHCWVTSKPVGSNPKSSTFWWPKKYPNKSSWWKQFRISWECRAGSQKLYHKILSNHNEYEIRDAEQFLSNFLLFGQYCV